MITVPGVRDGLRLVVPAPTDVHGLARPWFAHARWAVEPRTAAEALQQRRPAVGARFRGSALAPEATVGELLLAGGAVLVGPVPLPADVARRITVPDDHVAYGLRSDDSADPMAAQDTQAAERWVRAVARHARGVLVEGDAVVRPAPGSAVSMRWTTPRALPVDEALALVRRVVPRAWLVSSDAGGYALDVPSSYDGSIRLTVRADAEGVVTETAWLSPSGESDDGEGSDGPSLEAIARERLVPVAAKIVLRLLAVAPGEVTDADRLVVSRAQLDERAAR